MEDVSLIVTIFTLFLLTLVCIYGMYLAKRERSLRKQQDQLHKQVQKTLQDSLDHADRIIADATEKVREIVNSAHIHTSQMESRSEEALAAVSSQMKRRFQDDLSASEKLMDTKYREIIREMQDEFRSSLSEQLRKASDLTRSFTEEQFTHIQQELKDYEKAQKEALAKRVALSIDGVYQEVFEKQLSKEEHLRLVELALASLEGEPGRSQTKTS